MQGEKRLIHFAVDSKLERIWKVIGFTQKERMDEMQAIEDALMETYKQQIARNGEKLEKLRQKLREEELLFEKVKKKYGDTETMLPMNSNLSIREQIEVVHEVTDNLERSYSYRVGEFKRVLKQISAIFDELGATEEERQGFTEIGDEDLSEERLNVFKQRLSSLQDELEKRKDVMESLKSELLDLTEEIEEDVPEDIERAFSDFDNESVHTVSSAIDNYKQIRNERAEQVQYLSDEINDLYRLLAIDPSDRIDIPSAPSQKSIETLESEKEFLDEQKSIRLPAVLRELNKAITKICDYMHVPMRERPSYHGNDLEEGVRYLSEELETLKQKHIEEKPILDMIYELEKQKDAAARTPDISSKDRKSSRRVMESERLRKQTQSTTSKLERQLFSELVKYRKENGRDFMFGDVRYIDKLDVYNEGCQTEKKHRGRDLLLQKINESLSTTSFRTPRRHTAYTNM